MAPHCRDGCSLVDLPQTVNDVHAEHASSSITKKAMSDSTQLELMASTPTPGGSTAAQEYPLSRPVSPLRRLPPHQVIPTLTSTINATVVDQAGLSFPFSIWWPILPVTKLEYSTSGGALSSCSASNTIPSRIEKPSQDYPPRPYLGELFSKPNG
ncbi:hypothetical protein BKA70DRAFT_1225791 [Coprinopsis sp. MPI-PUGE-AT-0042]|nr:hypothetical protein BKA70DRAFT_1225791 [Coprinopsis sp. MPI-PUGE-AT-0042]